MVQVPLGLWGDAEVEAGGVVEPAPVPVAAADLFGHLSPTEEAISEAANQPVVAVAVEPTPAPPAAAEIVKEVAEFIVGADRDYCSPSDSTEPAPAPTDPELAAEMAQQQRIADAEQEYLQASMRVNEIEDEIAEKKAGLKEAKELQQALYVRLLAIQAGELDADDEEDEEDGEDSGDLDSTEIYDPENHHIPQATTASSDEAWRKQPLRDIIEGTAGCGQKKLDAICEQLPTLGAFVDLQASAGGVGIHTEMPKGVGRGLCDALEEKVLNWLSANRDKFGEAIETETPAVPANETPPQAPQEALPVPCISTEAAAPEGTGASNEADESDAPGDEAPNSPPQDTPPPAEAEPEADGIHAAQVRTRLETLQKRPPEEREPDFAVIGRNGAAAASEGQPAVECPFTAGLQQDSWLLGWLSQK